MNGAMTAMLIGTIILLTLIVTALCYSVFRLRRRSARGVAGALAGSIVGSAVAVISPIGTRGHLYAVEFLLIIFVLISSPIAGATIGVVTAVIDEKLDSLGFSAPIAIVTGALIGLLAALGVALLFQKWSLEDYQQAMFGTDLMREASCVGLISGIAAGLAGIIRQRPQTANS